MAFTRRLARFVHSRENNLFPEWQVIDVVRGDPYRKTFRGRLKEKAFRQSFGKAFTVPCPNVCGWAVVPQSAISPFLHSVSILHANWELARDVLACVYVPLLGDPMTCRALPQASTRFLRTSRHSSSMTVVQSLEDSWYHHQTPKCLARIGNVLGAHMCSVSRLYQVC